MESASFTAWQILGSKGLKKTWDQYRKGMGLVDNKKKISKADKKEAQNLAMAIHKKRMAAKSGK